MMNIFRQIRMVLVTLLALAGIVVLVGQLAGCACKSCPPEDAYIGATTPFGMLPLKVPKGHFDDRENWLSEEELNRGTGETGKRGKDAPSDGNAPSAL